MPNASFKGSATSGREAPTNARSTRAQRFSARDHWVQQIDSNQHFTQLFDLIDGVHFFAKNRHGETMYSSRGILDLYGFHDESEIVGLTDHDLNPTAMAQGYVADDARIFTTGEPVRNKVELWFDEKGLPDWYLVTKLPIHSRDGEIIGIMGILRHFEGTVALPADLGSLAPAVALIRKRFQEPLELADLAQAAQLSPRQLQRRFRETLGQSPQELIIRTRVLAAARTLRSSNRTIAEVAAECGFYDQSAFTEHFRRHLGQTPGRFRKGPTLSKSQANTA